LAHHNKVWDEEQVFWDKQPTAKAGHTNIALPTLLATLSALIYEYILQLLKTPK
jgi:hypothetical protein